MNRTKWMGFVLSLTLALPLTGAAGELAVSNAFTSGTPAVAADVNQNFSDVETAVNDNNRRITTNTTDISSNITEISANTSAIGTNAGRITANEADIATNASAISSNATAIGAAGTAINSNATAISSDASRITTNEGDIAANTTAIGTNTTSIGSNTTAIGANTAGISGNTLSIGSNTSAIAAHDARITANENEISTNIANITINTSDIATNTADIAANTTAITANSTDIATNAADIAALQGGSAAIVGAVYRWNVFSTYSYVAGWYATNNIALFGGVPPSNWGDGSALAGQMSGDKEVMRTLFTRKGYGGKNALVYADDWVGYGSTNSKHAVALFRIKNTTPSDIIWTPKVHLSAYPAWGERASVALNGVTLWDDGSVQRIVTDAAVSVPMTIPANRTSTAIFVSSSSPGATASGFTTRSILLAFVNDSLALPAGLEYVDDLDVATGDWTQ